MEIGNYQSFNIMTYNSAFSHHHIFILSLFLPENEQRLPHHFLFLSTLCTKQTNTTPCTITSVRVTHYSSDEPPNFTHTLTQSSNVWAEIGNMCALSAPHFSPNIYTYARVDTLKQFTFPPTALLDTACLSTTCAACI